MGTAGATRLPPFLGAREPESDCSGRVARSDEPLHYEGETMRIERMWDVYGSGYGWLGHVEARSERAARMWARRLWPDVKVFSVREV